VEFSTRPSAPVKTQLSTGLSSPVRLEFREGKAEIEEEITW